MVMKTHCTVGGVVPGDEECAEPYRELMQVPQRDPGDHRTRFLPCTACPLLQASVKKCLPGATIAAAYKIASRKHLD